MFVATPGLASIAVSQGYSLVVVCGLLIAVAFLVSEHGLSGTQVSVVLACGLSSCNSWALEHELNCCGIGLHCSAASGIFPDRRSNSCVLYWQADSLPLPPGMALCHFLIKQGSR